MKYERTLEARFLDRPNRFVAHVALERRQETVHVKNTGRCRELLLPGSRVILTPGTKPGRKTAYDLIAVEKTGLGWVNIDSQAPNAVVKEWLEGGSPLFPGLSLLKPEYRFGDFRVDFYLECGRRRILLEVKGCTLEREGLGYFPDAPTQRGLKHLRELQGALALGYECYVAFVIALPGVQRALPNRETHPEFADALEAAARAGVHILHLPCHVAPDELTVCDALEG